MCALATQPQRGSWFRCEHGAGSKLPSLTARTQGGKLKGLVSTLQRRLITHLEGSSQVENVLREPWTLLTHPRRGAWSLGRESHL